MLQHDRWNILFINIDESNVHCYFLAIAMLLFSISGYRFVRFVSSMNNVLGVQRVKQLDETYDFGHESPEQEIQ